MCGRYAFNADPNEVKNLFGLVEIPDFLEPRYNVARRNSCRSSRRKAAGLTAETRPVVLGLVPYWANEPKGFRPVNARSEGVATNGTFRNAFAKQRCLMVATGFYEWQAAGKKGKQPYHFRMRDGRPFAFAGLWERWAGEDKPLLTCCSLTTTPNELVGAFHDRMPVIVHPNDFTTWLKADTPVRELQKLLRPYPTDEMVAFPVSTYVSKSGNEGPQCLEPLRASA